MPEEKQQATASVFECSGCGHSSVIAPKQAIRCNQCGSLNGVYGPAQESVADNLPET
jgi:ribosomal protein S27E